MAQPRFRRMATSARHPSQGPYERTPGPRASRWHGLARQTVGTSDRGQIRPADLSRVRMGGRETTVPLPAHARRACHLSADAQLGADSEEVEGTSHPGEDEHDREEPAGAGPGNQVTIADSRERHDRQVERIEGRE